MIKNILTFLVNDLVVVGLIVLVAVFSGSSSVGGTVHNFPEWFFGGLTAGPTGTTVINTAGQWIGAVNTAISSTVSGTFKLSNGSTKTWNPPSFSSSTIATTSVQMSVSAGDRLVVSFDSATSTEQWYAVGTVTATGTNGSSTIALIAIPGTSAWNAGLDISTSTLRVDVISR